MTEIIRLAIQADRAAIEELVRLAYGHYVKRIGRKPGPMLDDYAARIAAGQAHVIERDAALQGLVVLIPEADAMLLDNIAVAPAAQGTGLGRGLLAFAERSTIDAGLPTIRLYTNAAMTENLRLYARLGYVETHRGETDGLYRVYMRKQVATDANGIISCLRSQRSDGRAG